VPDLSDYRPQIEAALAYEGGAHTYDDIVRGVENGAMRAWYGPHSIVITQVDEQPHQTALHFFLAGGVMAELEAMTDGILRWGDDQGCTVARFIGRRGWTRSFLARTGWKDTGLVIMERAING
jgi:hypothetical protein